MKLENILKSLDENNIKQLIYILKNSKCKKCISIYEKLCNGDNFFDILHDYLDNVGQILIKPKTISCLNIVGSYMIYKQNFHNSLKLVLIYPMFLLIAINIIMMIIHFILSISKYIFFIQILFIPVILLSYFYIKNNYLKFMRIFLLKTLMYNQLNMSDLRHIFSEMSIDICLQNTNNISQLSEQIINQSCCSLEEIDVVFQIKEAELTPILEQTCKWINYFCLFLISCIILIIFFDLNKSMVSILNI